MTSYRAQTVVVPASAFRISYSYDALGNRTILRMSTGGRISYTYDVLSRNYRVVNAESDVTTIAYDAASNRTATVFANGTRCSVVYDPAARVARLATLASGGTTLTSFSYRYDSVGNRTQVVEVDASIVTWLYDRTDQITGEQRTGTAPFRNTFSYDACGNRMVLNANGTMTTSVFDAAMQLKYTVSGGIRTTYTYDANGNQVGVLFAGGARNTTTWDYEDRGTRYALGTGPIVTMVYNADHLRVRKET